MFRRADGKSASLWSSVVGRSSRWKHKPVLVTGATGFIGRHLVQRLTRMDAQVYAGTSPRETVNMQEIFPQRAPQVLTFDVRHAAAVRDTIEESRPNVVFHLAAVGVTNPSVDPMLALTVNVGGVINLLEALRGSEVERVVLTGTSYEYGACGATKRLDPFNAYSASKVAAWAFGQMYQRAHHVPVVTVRPFQVYGPGQPDHTLISAAMNTALSGEDFPMTLGEQERDFIFVEDVADGMIAAVEADAIEGESLDLGTGTGVAVRKVVEQIWELADAAGSMRPGARPYRTGAAMHLVADADRTARLTGWRATTPLDRGLQATMKHMKSGM